MSILFCSGEGEARRFAVGPNLMDVEDLIGCDGRIATDDDVKMFFAVHQLADLTLQVIATRFGTTRQTASNWRRRADLGPTRYQQRVAAKRAVAAGRANEQTGLATAVGPDDIVGGG